MTVIVEMIALGMRYHHAGNLDRAEALYRQVLNADPGHADARHLLGVVAYQRGQFEQAVASIEHALTLNSNVAKYHMNLGLAYQGMDRLNEAVACYQQAVKLKP